MREGRSGADSGLYIPAFITGLGILVAQIAWNRRLLILIGGSVDAAAAVLAAFMLGLGLGGRFLGRRGEFSPDPRRLLGRIILSAAALSMLPLLLYPLLIPVYPLLYGSGLPMGLVRFLIAVIMVFPATFFAGGVIPVMGRIAETGGTHREVSRLYGLNAIGSATGGLLAGFFLLEQVGGPLSMLIGALVCAASVPFIARGGRSRPRIQRPDLTGRPRTVLLVIYGITGMIALGFEVVWARQLTFVLGNSTYAFATMGIIVLTGIGLGSLAGQKVTARIRDPLAAFGLAELGLGLTSVLPLAALGSFGDLASMLTPGHTWLARTMASFIAAAIYMLPSTVFMGATFPLMISAAASRNRLGSDTGMLSMTNCMGAALGAVLTSQLLFHLAGPTVSGTVLAICSVLTGGVVLVLAGRRGLAALAVPASAAVVLILAYAATPPGSRPPEGLDLLFFEEDRTATVSVFGREWDDYRSLRINGVEEVPVDQASLEAFYLLGHLPWGYNPTASSVMMVAMGGGITSGAVLTHPVDTLICVELCPAVRDAAWIFEKENGRPDLDPRFTLMADDGRNYLLGCGRRFDLVVCDATHPGSADSWVLYTREFYGTMLDALEPGGVAAQWVPLHQLPSQDLQRILATWAGVFPHYSVHLAGGRHAILVGSDSALSLDIEAIFADEGAAIQLASVGFTQDEPQHLMPLISDPGLDSLVSETSSGVNTDARSHCQFIRRRVPLDPQATIPADVALLLALSGGSVPELLSGQMLYWGDRLPEAVSVLRAGDDTPLERRWLAVSLTSAAEQMHLTSRGTEALPLLEEALSIDPSWERHRRLIELIEATGDD